MRSVEFNGLLSIILHEQYAWFLQENCLRRSFSMMGRARSRPIGGRESISLKVIKTQYVHPDLPEKDIIVSWVSYIRTFVHSYFVVTVVTSQNHSRKP